MYVVTSNTAKDYFYFLPKATAWVKAADTLAEMAYRARAAEAAEKALPIPDGDGDWYDIYVGYDAEHDQPIFIRKYSKGFIAIASVDPIRMLPD